MEELKPCPFCGSEADIKCEGKNAWSVECMNEHCGVFLPTDSWYISRENAIKAWNTRPFDNFKPCLCSKSEAKTVKRITSQIWQCPRCGGLGSISEPAVVPLNEKELADFIYKNRGDKDSVALAKVICETFGTPAVSVPSFDDIYYNLRHCDYNDTDYISNNDLKGFAKAIHALLTSGKVKEPQWPRIPNMINTEDNYYTKGWVDCLISCKQAWKDAQ